MEVNEIERAKMIINFFEEEELKELKIKMKARKIKDEFRRLARLDKLRYSAIPNDWNNNVRFNELYKSTNEEIK